jgi:hypothetical protein
MALAVFIGVSLGAIVWANATDGQVNTPAWAAPKAMAVKRVGALSQFQNQPNLFGNLDCTPTSYRTVSSSTMQIGCFTQTAFGQINSDDDSVIYNATDEALPLLPYSGHEILAPWPQAGVLVALDPALVSGTYINLYKDPLAVMHNQRNQLGELIAKQLTAPPDLQLRGPDGQPLVIDPQTLAFSDEGSWLVAEDLSGSFVRINLATLDVLPFAPAYGSNGSPALLRSQVAISRDGRYVAINNEAAGAFKIYDLSTCDGQTATNLSPLNCQSYDYRYFVAQQISGLQTINHVRFINDGLISFEARTSDSDRDGVYELAPSANITSLIDYLGLGDSYTSGEGAFDYTAGTDSADNSCHLSINSYPFLLTHDLFGEQSGHSVACSGAEINDIDDLNGNYRGQVKDGSSWQALSSGDPTLLDSIMTNFSPGYIAQERFVQQYQPRIISVGVGGNDIGFGDILQECVEPKLSLHISSEDCFNTYESRLELKNLIDRTEPRWVNLYRSLQNSAPATRLYVIGYPQIVSDTGDCALNVHLSKSELEFTEEIIDYLNGDVRQAAAQAGVSYVDISHALDGHRLCEAASYDVAVNGLTAGGDASILGVNVFGKESYHPNALGQHLIEQAILKQTNNFAEATEVSDSPPDDGQLLNAPKSGQTVYNRVPQDGLAATEATAGHSIAVSIDGSRAGLQPDTTYSIHLDGPSGAQIGTVTSGDSGDISGAGIIPNATDPGGHTIDVTGSDQDGNPIDVTQPIYVPAANNDSDGDGIPDSQDSCPYAVNSGIDSDHDGIDDVCDPLIGRPPTSTGPSDATIPTSDGDFNVDLQADDDDSVWLGSSPLTVASGLAIRPNGKAIILRRVASKKIINNLSPASIKRITKPSLPFSNLQRLNWLTWMILITLIWWLMVLIYMLFRTVRRFKSRY